MCPDLICTCNIPAMTDTEKPVREALLPTPFAVREALLPTPLVFAYQSPETIDRRTANRNLNCRGRFIATAYDIFDRHGTLTPGFQKTVNALILRQIKDYCVANSITNTHDNLFDDLVVQKYYELEASN